MTESTIGRAYDVVVIGGGPAGASAAIGLAEHGIRALVLERRRFPRFHVGESMLPYMAGLLQQKGVLSRLEKCGFVIKRGAEFTTEKGEKLRVDFSSLGPKRLTWTFQVERARFDEAMLEHAREAGATVLEGAKVHDLTLENDRIRGVKYEYDGEIFEIATPYIIDASGRAGKLAHKFDLRKMDDKLRMVAIYQHFSDLNENMNPGHRGDIQIGSHPEGWLWAIPIGTEKISIGAVVPKERLRAGVAEEIFDKYNQRFPRVSQRLRGTRPAGEIRVESDYCYYTDQVTGPGWLMAGDSGCFADPIFSGGVFLAVVTGFEAAKAINQVRTGIDENVAFDRYERFYKTGYDTYMRLIYAYYEADFNFKKYLKKVAPNIGIEWNCRMLSGDFWSPHNPIGHALRKESRWDTFAPFELVQECPVYPELDVAE